MNEFTIFHQYQRAVDEGLADPIKCPNDGSRLFTTGVDFETGEPVPALTCYECDIILKPGLAVRDQLRDELERIR